MNCVTTLAAADNRDYITPEDVSDALRLHPVEAVRLAVLEVLGRQAGFGAEDGGLCAFVAFRGEPTDLEGDAGE